MKKIISNIMLLAMIILLVSCRKDNFKAPKIYLTGTITYQGEALNLRGSGEAIQIQLYQDGYELHNPINVFVGQEGKFSALLFKGMYKLVTRDKNGPWVNNRDTTVINLTENKSINLEVTPYFLIKNSNIKVTTTTMHAMFNIEQIVPDVSIDRVMLLLSKTQFVDDVNNVFRQDFKNMKAGNIDLTADISNSNKIKQAKALFARVAVKAKGADQAIYSPVVPIK